MLTGKKIILRAPLSTDVDFFHSIRNNTELQAALITRAKPNSKAKVQQWLNKRCDEENTLFFVIEENTSKKPCGFIQLTDINVYDQHSKLGVCISSDHIGKGYAKEAMSISEKYIKYTINVNKIILEVLTENRHAINLYEKCGYRSIGYFEKHFYYNGIFHNVSLMEKII